MTKIQENLSLSKSKEFLLKKNECSGAAPHNKRKISQNNLNALLLSFYNLTVSIIFEAPRDLKCSTASKVVVNYKSVTRLS